MKAYLERPDWVVYSIRVPSKTDFYDYLSFQDAREPLLLDGWKPLAPAIEEGRNPFLKDFVWAVYPSPEVEKGWSQGRRLYVYL